MAECVKSILVSIDTSTWDVDLPVNHLTVGRGYLDQSQ